MQYSWRVAWLQSGGGVGNILNSSLFLWYIELNILHNYVICIWQWCTVWRICKNLLCLHIFSFINPETHSSVNTRKDIDNIFWCQYALSMVKTTTTHKIAFWKCSLGIYVFTCAIQPTDFLIDQSLADTWMVEKLFSCTDLWFSESLLSNHFLYLLIWDENACVILWPEIVTLPVLKLQELTNKPIFTFEWSEERYTCLVVVQKSLFTY